MKTRWGLVGLASAALAAGLLVPVSVSAAPDAAKPSGEALVRIDGGTAQAERTGRGLYRVTLPRESSIKWMGETNRKLAVGTIGRKGLVAAWTRLGHSASGKGAMTTLTWQRPGDKRPTYVGAFIAKPKVNADGQLTFLAKTVGALPSSLPNFSVNIARPDHDSRATRSSYPLSFPVNASSSTVGVHAIAIDDNHAAVEFVKHSNGVVTGLCGTPATINMSTNSSAPPAYLFAGTCGDTTWQSGSVTFYSASQHAGSAQLQMSAVVTVKKDSGPTGFKWNFNMGEWKPGPVVVWPV